MMTAAHGRANVPVALSEEKPSETTLPDQGAPVFVAPPRTIKDIAAIFDEEKPDPVKIAKLQADADGQPPNGVSRRDLAWFYYLRANARNQLGRLKEAIADIEKGLEIARGAAEPNFIGRLQQLAGRLYMTAGRPRQALALYLEHIRTTDAPGARGYIHGGHFQLSKIYIMMGDLAQAEAYLRRNEAHIITARTSGLPGWRQGYAELGHSWESIINAHRGMLFEVRGQYREAEANYLVAERHRRASFKGLMNFKVPQPEEQLQELAENLVLAQARVKAKQGRLAEAEADARRALIARLRELGKYNALMPKYITGLADILVEQGRHEEAEQLTRIAIEINRRVGVIDSSHDTATMLASLGDILVLRGQSAEATEVYAELDKAIADWDPQTREALELNGSRIYTLFASDRIQAGIAAAQALIKRLTARVGERHFETASARGILAIGYMRAGKDAEALKEFSAAVPILVTGVNESSDADDASLVAARRLRAQMIVEAYLSLVAKDASALTGKIAAETFHIADAVRGQSVQRAVASSGARMIAKDEKLGELIRQEQDLALQVRALLGTLNNSLELPPGERDEAGVKSITATIALLRAERVAVTKNIINLFPNYGELIDPKPTSVADVQKALRPGEVMLSFYFGQSASFVWGVGKGGDAVLAPLRVTASDLEIKVRELRKALDFEVGVVSTFPPYNVALAHELYAALMQPVEAVWKPAKSLIVIANGALGLMPLPLLVTALPHVPASSAALFADYRNVPWLARTHAISMVPSSAAFRTLRTVPAASKERQPLIGFGDPYFTEEQAADADREAKPTEVAQLDMGMTARRRSLPRLRDVNSADLALLQRLPDTALELKAIAAALNADPATSLYLGRKANEGVVKSIDLSKFRIVAFATHGLMPGDLNGLTQPALAFSAPSVANVEGDGLLTMEEILPLKLDADWVVLSACNTATGATAGAEAASGLGRAFFYAGSRALLLTNWPVETISARNLVSDLFRRQAADAQLSRAEALQRAMLGIMDGPGYSENGIELYTYAHPMFWGPYSLIGDGAN
jgi:CHAT domain-containing protein/tetratricopeptide (TPR) repeat protein